MYKPESTSGQTPAAFMDLIGNQWKWKPRFLDSVMPRCARTRIAPISDRQRPNHGSESWQLTEAAPWPWTVRALTKDHSTDVMRPKSPAEPDPAKGQPSG